MSFQDWSLDSYNYHLPEELIAQVPAPQRDHSRMLVMNKENGEISHHSFYEIVSFLPDSICLVVNNTKVLPVRLPGNRATGGAIEALLIEEKELGLWSALVRKAARIKAGEKLSFCKGEITAMAKERMEEGEWLLEFDEPKTLKSRLNEVGLPPLPPYIERRKANEVQNAEDKKRYQTCFASEPGAIAAPTAGLHFTPEIMAKIKEKGIEIIEVTLHVGLGTFSSITENDIRNHKMHSEYFSVSETACQKLREFKSQQKKIIGVGTTSVRVLETLAQREFTENSGWTNIFIYPPYRFKMIDGLLTNFHLPQSTLMMLVASLCGKDKLLAAYQQAVYKK